MAKSSTKAVEQAKPTQSIRLNKLISNAGVCARRAADTLIQTGQITVNGQQVTTLGDTPTGQLEPDTFTSA